MTDEKIKESILIAEEVGKEICTGKVSTSALAEQWKGKSPELYEDLKKQSRIAEEIAFHNSINTTEALQEINKRIVLPPANRFNLRIIGIAASLLLIAGISSLWIWTDRQEKDMTEWTSTIPGQSKPVLTTQDHKIVELTDNHLTIKNNHLIAGAIDGKNAITVSLRPDKEFNKLSVPNGGEYKLTLEDGTTVQVNAASELLFLTHFEPHSRQVKLKGEACFRVKTDVKRPFYVQLDNLNIQVTGTVFNVKAYMEEEDITITLIEGSINIREGQQLLATLSPGQQFSYQKNKGQYAITEANISAATAWTEERFVFNNETIGNIMRELSRWYNVDIRTSEDIQELRYSGMLSRKQPLTEILNALQLTKELDFKMHKDKTIDAIEKKNQ